MSVPLLALLFLGAALITDAPSSDPRLSFIDTSDDQGLPVERLELKPDGAPPGLAAEGPGLESHRAAVWAAAPPPAIRLVEAATLGGPATRAPPSA